MRRPAKGLTGSQGNDETSTLMPDEPSHTGIKELGWRQGRFVPDALATRIAEGGYVPEMATGDVLLVVSHDCDVTHGSLEKEPLADILLCRRLRADPDGNLTLGKNPRVLQFVAASGDEEVWFEARAYERCAFPRELLAEEPPDDSLILPEKMKRLVRNWCADRYSREYFPDEFNRRLSEVADQIRQNLNRTGQYLSAIYFQGAEEELNPEVSYVLDVVGAMKPDDYADPKKREQAVLAISRVEALIAKAPGVRVDSSVVLSERSISLADVEFLKRWDTDAMSLKTEPEGPVPPGR
jgi:hypothetical protein